VFLFVFGFVLGLIVVLLVAFLMHRMGIVRICRGGNEHSRKLEELAKLTGRLAHEIKNPLSTIKVNLKLITEDLEAELSTPPKCIRKIEVVQNETDRLVDILDDFLHYIGQPELRPKNVKINDLVGEMVDFYGPQADRNNIKIRLGLSDKPSICNIDVNMVKQVLLNLFINAQQAMPNGGELIIRTNTLGRSAVIEVSDTGQGIPPGNIEKIFEAYHTSRSGGSGLGLAIARKIIDAHNGSIKVESQQGRGSSFVITLPIAAG